MMAPGYLDDVRAIVQEGRLRQGHPDPRGRRGPEHPERHHRARALAALGDEDCNVLLHDAVRPLVSQTIIDANVEALQTYEAVDTAIPSADTVIQVDDPGDRRMADVLPRHLLRRGQTPQSFRLSTIRAAYAKAARGPRLHRDRRLHRRAALPAGGADRGRPRPRAQHEGHRADRRLHSPTSSSSSTSADQPAALSRRGVPRAARRQDHGRLRRLVRDRRATSPSSRASYGATVQSFSRSGDRHPRRAARGHRRGRRRGAGRDRPGRLRGQHRRRAAPRRAGRVHRGDDLRGDRGQLPGADLHRPGVLPAPGRDQGSLLLFTSSSYTRGRSGYSLYSSAKAAVVNLTQALADEWADTGVRVNCINPERTGDPDAHQGLRRGAAGHPAHRRPRWPGSPWTCCSPGRPATSSTSAARTARPPSRTADP